MACVTLDLTWPRLIHYIYTLIRKSSSSATTQTPSCGALLSLKWCRVWKNQGLPANQRRKPGLTSQSANATWARQPISDALPIELTASGRTEDHKKTEGLTSRSAAGGTVSSAFSFDASSSPPPGLSSPRTPAGKNWRWRSLGQRRRRNKSKIPVTPRINLSGTEIQRTERWTRWKRWWR